MHSTNNIKIEGKAFYNLKNKRKLLFENSKNYCLNINANKLGKIYKKILKSE